MGREKGKGRSGRGDIGAVGVIEKQVEAVVQVSVVWRRGAGGVACSGTARGSAAHG